MSKYARVVNGVVAEVIESDPATLFNSTVAAMFQSCPDNVRVGWTFDENEWTEPEVPEVVTRYRELTPMELMDLCATAGGMTNELFAQAWQNPQLVTFVGSLQLAKGVERGHPRTEAGLMALEALGYLPDGAQAVLDAWPTE
jgi:hypothetical protein